MSEFVSNTMSDIRGGRDSWRVLLLVTIPSFAIGVGLSLARVSF